jgi:hypothetical protein
MEMGKRVEGQRAREGDRGEGNRGKRPKVNLTKEVEFGIRVRFDLNKARGSK